MWPLLLCSIIALAIIIERIIFMLRVSPGKKTAALKLRESLERDSLEKAIMVCEKNPHFISKSFMEGVITATEKNLDIIESVEESFANLISRFGRYTLTLSFLSQICTLIGFTGTVVGMIHAFESIVARGTTSPAIVASGIAEALITTAYGLCIAIPCVVFYAILSSQEDALANGMDSVLKALEKAVAKRPQLALRQPKTK
ncbi:MotA/TolQ/ExbB proton channel family protein [Elusimicrobiota bacterium]